MSVKVMSMVWESDLPRPEKMILLAYADHSHDDGSSTYPGIGRVAWKTGYRERQVIRITQSLVELGYLTIDGQSHLQTVIYHINLDALPKRPPYVGDVKKSQASTAGGDILSKPTAISTAGGDISDEKPAQMTPKSSINHQIEPSTEPGSSFFTSDDWQNVKDELRGSMTRATYDNLIAHTEFAGVDNRNGTPVVVVRPRNANEVEWLNQRLATAITPVLLEYCQMPVAFKAALEAEPA